MTDAFINFLKACKDPNVDLYSAEFRNRQSEWLKEKKRINGGDKNSS